MSSTDRNAYPQLCPEFEVVNLEICTSDSVKYINSTRPLILFIAL